MDTTFENFEGLSGAAVSADTSYLSVNNAKFTNSTSTLMGAAIAVKDSETYISSTEFSGSSSKYEYTDDEFSDNFLSKYTDQKFGDEAFASIAVNCTGKPEPCDSNE